MIPANELMKKRKKNEPSVANYKPSYES